MRQTLGTILGAAATVFAASIVIFFGLALAPGDPVAQILGAKSTDTARAQMRESLGLDDPLPQRYWDWLTGALQGDFGTSLTQRQDVTALIGPRMETTFLLVIMSALLVLIVGIGLGIVGGISRKGRAATAGLVALAIAVPSFVAANVLISTFAVGLGWFPTFGAGDGLVDQIWHLTLPSIALSIGFGAYLTQLTSASVAEEAEKEYVVTARGRGIPSRVVLRHHTLRNAALPVLTASGLSVAGLVAGTLIVEQAFGIDGLGNLLVKSVGSKDYPVVCAISIIIVLAFVVINSLIDLMQIALDPRERAKA